VLARLARDRLRQHQAIAVRLYADAHDLFARLAPTDLKLALIANAASDSARDTLAAPAIFAAAAKAVEAGLRDPFVDRIGASAPGVAGLAAGPVVRTSAPYAGPIREGLI
jgi:hypothetical protein